MTLTETVFNLCHMILYQALEFLTKITEDCNS